MENNTQVNSQVILDEKVDNKLVGWLISFKLNSLGKFFEIRTGRTFLGFTEVKGNKNIIIEPEGISSPHLAIFATMKHKVFIQDLFSEQGTYIKNFITGKEVRITGPVSLEQGDLIRIGKGLKLQVCLINDPSR